MFALTSPRMPRTVSTFSQRQTAVDLSNYFYLMGTYDQSIASGQHAFAIATASGDVVLHALANRFLALADELGMRPLLAHCHLDLGTLYAATSQREQARTELSTAIALYRSMEMTFWLPQAEAALAQVEGQ